MGQVKFTIYYMNINKESLVYLRKYRSTHSRSNISMVIPDRKRSAYDQSNINQDNRMVLKKFHIFDKASVAIQNV